MTAGRARSCSCHQHKLAHAAAIRWHAHRSRKPATMPDTLPRDPRRRIWLTATSIAGRSIRPEMLVLVAICTHLGFVTAFRPTPGTADIGSSWPVGLDCPCHGSTFDLGGRVFRHVPAPTHLVVPPYHFASNGILRIGVDVKA
jgi:Rieske Fe-S protein